MESARQTRMSRSLTADRQPLDEFNRRVLDATKKHPNATYASTTLDLFEWSEGADNGVEHSDLKSVRGLEAKSEGAVRVIFAPRDIPTPGAQTLVELFETCGIPSKFVDESLRGVSQSFAVREDVDGTTWIWFHLLCKTLTVLENQIVPKKGHGQVDNEKVQSRNATQAQSHADFTWLKPGIVLKIRKRSDTHTKPTRTATSDSDATLATAPVKSKVELICFGAPSSLHDRIRAVIATTSCEELLEDPYMFLDIAFEEMYKILDCTAWAVADKFGPMEYQTLQIAIEPGKSVDELPKEHFTGLHNLAKHTIYLRENCEAALATLDDLYSHHKAATGDHPEPLQKHTRQGLKYRKTLFESTQRRLTSLDARISNIIELSFNIVTQGDSKVMQSESQSMKTIAVMTLLFMPLGTVASIFGSQFMMLQDERPYHLTVSQDFWLMWVIAVPLTIAVVTIWWVWYMDAKAKYGVEVRKREHDYMGWKTLPQTLRRMRVKKGITDV